MPVESLALVAPVRHSITTAQVELPHEASPASPTPTLVVVDSVDSARVGSRWPLKRGQVTVIGRDVSEAGLDLCDPGVSRVHARCAWSERRQGVILSDAQSRNGTFVDARPIEERLLRHGDAIRVGHSLIVYDERDEQQTARERARELARTDLTLLIGGETGSGKERFARMVHEASGREGPFVAVNCAAIPKELVAAELFGHTKTAFSGATQARKGLFASAQGGSILLDEIGDCPPDVQIALLRVLQEKAVRPVGAERELPIDVRVLAATHQDLEQAVERGSFRADLYARLKQATLVVPAVRDCRSELLVLAKNIAREAGSELTWTVDAAEALLAWSWPFNVRELQSLVRAFVATRRDAPLDLRYLSDNHPKLAQSLVRRERRAEEGARVEEAPVAMRTSSKDHRHHIRDLLRSNEGNVSKVASALGKPRAQVYRWMRVMGLSAESFRLPRRPPV